jgi:hypothetical protein
LKAFISRIDSPQQPLNRRSDEPEQDAGDDQARQDPPRRQAGGADIADESDAEISAERKKRAARQIDNLLHAEHELKARGHQKLDGGVKHAAGQYICKCRHQARAVRP